MPAIYGSGMQHLWRIDQGDWALAQKEPSGNRPEKANAYHSQCHHTGAGINGKRIAGHEQVPGQHESKEHEGHQMVARKTERQNVPAVHNEQSQTTMVCRDHEVTSCRDEGSCCHTSSDFRCHRAVSSLEDIDSCHQDPISDTGFRAGHTPSNNEGTPANLEAKTGRLEKRLLLRQFITKALEIKRAEIAEHSGRTDAGQPPSKTVTITSKISPQRLTFYEVVQLARQQAFAEKTRMANQDLIDLSDRPQPSNSASLTGDQSNLTLLDSSNLTLSQQFPPTLSSPNNHEMLGLRLMSGTTNEQDVIAELDAEPPLEPPSVDLIELIELDTSRACGFDEQTLVELSASTPTPRSYTIEARRRSESLMEPGRDQPGLEIGGTEATLSEFLDTREGMGTTSVLATVSPPTMSQQSSVAVLERELSSENISDKMSVASSAAPSIFSHSSSLTSATGCSLPGISEQELQTRNSSSQSNLKTHLLNPATPAAPSLLDVQALSPLDPPIQERLASDASSEMTSRIDPTVTTPTQPHVVSLPQRNPTKDSVSLHSSTPQLPDIDEPDGQGFPWIVQAARDGNIELVQKLLLSGADIHASHTITKRNALVEATLRSHHKVVDLLIEEGCSLECADIDGNTALHYACEKGQLAIAKSLITGAAPINASGSEGQSALHLAMWAPYQNIVMLLVQHKANINARDAAFRTPLHIGACQGNVAMCSYLLNEGAQLDSREAQSKTPLQLACEAGHYELARVMLDVSKLNPSNMTFLTAFFAAVEHGHVRIAETFLSHGFKLQDLTRDRYKPLTLAAKSGCLAMVELMIQNDCETNALDDSGWNSLHFASYHGHYQIIERLLSCAVSAKATTSRKETPLLLAVKRGHFPVAERLLRSDGVSTLVNAEDERSQKPVHHAARIGSVEIFELLMSNGGKVDVENSFGWQPLHIATAYGHLALVERLLQQGINIEEKLGSTSFKKPQTHKLVEEGYWAEARWPYPGSRALHLACEYRQEQIANLLISKGAKLGASCSEGWQPLHHATYFGASALVDTLLHGGVNPHATTNEGKTASTIGFCQAGTEIPEEETKRIELLLKEAMQRVKKQKAFKVALRKASTVQDKHNLLKAATFSMGVVTRPQLHKAKTSAQITSPASSPFDTTSKSHRPRLSRLPHTTPLPPNEPPIEATLDLPTIQDQMKPATLPSEDGPAFELADTGATPDSSSNTARSNSITAIEVHHSSTTDIAAVNTLSSPAATKPQLSIQPEPKLKRRTTFGLAKVKPGVDIDKLSLATMMSKSTFDISKQTLDLGKQTLELGKQGLEISKQGLEKSRQGLEKGKRGVGLGKQKYDKAMKFARKGKRRGGDDMIKAGPLEGSKDGVSVSVIDEGAEGKDDDEGGSDCNDARSDFSLGEFANVGSRDF